MDCRLDSVAFKEGPIVKRGTLLALVDPRPFAVQLQQAEGALARDQAHPRAAARSISTATPGVAKDKLIAQQQADDQGVLVGQLEGSAKLDQAQIDQAKLMLDWARIRSPIDGVTGVWSIPATSADAAEAAGIVAWTAKSFLHRGHLYPAAGRARANTKGDGRGQAGGRSPVARRRQGAGQRHSQVIDNQINVATAMIRLKAIFANTQ